MSKTKQMEAKEDLKRYKEMLEHNENLEDRSFLMAGIINIDEQYRNNKIGKRLEVWNLMERIDKSFYSHQAIANFCALSLEDIKQFTDGKLPNEKTLKQIYIGLTVHGI